jgi:hypothetical protein
MGRARALYQEAAQVPELMTFASRFLEETRAGER